MFQLEPNLFAFRALIGVKLVWALKQTVLFAQTTASGKVLQIVIVSMVILKINK
jgi:hypothetical protein